MAIPSVLRMPRTRFGYSKSSPKFSSVSTCARRTPSPQELTNARRKTPESGSRTVTPSQTSTNATAGQRSEEHTSELQSHLNLVCRLLLEKKKDPNPYVSADRLA